VAMGILVGALLFLLLLSTPVAFSIALAAATYLLQDGRFPVEILVQRSIAGVNSFGLLALPLFILVGYLMELGSTPRLMRLANALLGPLPGGLAVANVGASALFGAVSGSGVATIAAIGGIMGPEMVRRGYPGGYSAALMAASGGLGILIPPSVPMIIFGLVGGVSIGTLFLGSIIPGLITAGLLAATAMFVAGRRGYGTRTTFRVGELGPALLYALPPLFLPVLILGGILGGFFTPTEAAAVGAVYAALLEGLVYRALTWARLRKVLADTVITSSVILVIIATSAAFAWIVTINQVPATVGAWLGAISDSPLIIFLMIQFFFLILGVFMETTAIIIITTPIFLPIAISIGIDPVVYGVVLIINLIIGAMTPPLAVGIYTATRIINVKPIEVNRYLLMFIVPLMASGLLHMLFPEITLFLPRLFEGPP